MGGIPAVGGAFTLRQAEKLAERADAAEAAARGEEPAPKPKPAPEKTEGGEAGN